MVYRRRGYRKCWKPPPKGQRLKVKPYVKKRIVEKLNIVIVEEGQREVEDMHSAATSEGIHNELSTAPIESNDVEGFFAKECYHESHGASEASQECPLVIKPCDIGYYILTKYLGLDVGAYFSSEIDLSAIRVQLHNFGDKVTPVGGIEKITNDQLASLGHIDLIIGGSPCEELSRANWRRKGLDDPSGTSVLYYQYTRVLNFFKEMLFWLFENTAAMDSKTKEKITL
ncbi:DNA (cytosine-5)-methyltransferase 3B [Frankliniella fusca]|uniref:DNA (cytosine-5-)-methyltransferase n=1 Tax=Frankliniella fusca TaxID=407009 RepID=A0AAE1HLP4_9NEOP|nr:DNA (cytosine-5)-methyltransferase 3B [Frankliniella fusca]